MVSFGREPKEKNRMAVRKPKGRNYWMVDLYDKAGRRIRRKVGGSKKQAERVEAELKVKIANEAFLGIVDPKRIRLRDFTGEFLEWAAVNRAKSTTTNYGYTIKELLPIWGDLFLQQITPKMVEDFKVLRAKQVSRLSENKRVKPRTVNKDLNVIKCLFTHAVDWGYLKESPAKKVTKLKATDDSFRFLSQEEADLLLDACGSSKCKDLYAIVVTGMHTGMRKEELFNLQWQHIKFKERVIEVVSSEDHPTKTRKSRTIPMSDFLTTMLRKHPRRIGSPYVFVSQYGNKFKDIHSTLDGARRKAGIEHLTPHTLRHTFASWAVMAGVDLVSVKDLMGHSSIEQTMRYAHLSPQHLRASVSFLDCLHGHHVGTTLLFSGTGNS